MEQYENKYKDFKFLGTVPIDFDAISNLGISDLNLGKLIKDGKSKIGLVFNLDESHQAGSHWVSFFSNLKEGQVYFFDSYGMRPEFRIRKFMRRVAKFCQTDLGSLDSVDRASGKDQVSRFLLSD